MLFHKNWDHIAESPRFVYNDNYNYINKGNKFYMYPLWLRHRTVKFLFLSDCISKFIQRYSLKRSFALYLSSILKNRFFNLYLSNFDSIWNTIQSFLKQLNLLKSNNNTHLFIKVIKKKNISLFLYVYYINFINYKWYRISTFLKKLNNNKLLNYIYTYFYFRKFSFYNCFITNSISTFKKLLSLTFLDYKKIPFLIFLSSISKIRFIKSFYLYSLLIVLNCYTHYFSLFSKNYSIPILNNLISSINRNKHIFFNFSFLKFNKSYYLKCFLEQTYSNIYYYFYVTKLTNLKYTNLLSYFSFFNLKWKITFLSLLQKSFFTWYNVFGLWLELQHMTFLNFFNNWVLKRRNLVPFYRRKSVLTFVLNMVYKISTFLHRFDSFSTDSNGRFGRRDLYKVNKFSIYSSYDVHRKKRLGRSLFLNNNYFQKKLLTILGKKKYKDFFYFRTNVKHSINSFLQMHYNMNIKAFSQLYNFLNRKYSLYKVKDLFFFLEYKINIFFKKYLYDISLERVILLKSSSSMDSLFVGDIIIRKNASFNFIKFYVFFNFIFFVDPLKLKCKFNLLSTIYNHIYNSFLSRCLNDYNFYESGIMSSFSLCRIYWFKIFNFIYSSKNDFFIDNGKSFIKSLIYYNCDLSNKKKHIPTFSHLIPKKNILKFFSVSSISKSYKQYSLINYNSIFLSNFSKGSVLLENDSFNYRLKKCHNKMVDNRMYRANKLLKKTRNIFLNYYPFRNFKYRSYMSFDSNWENRLELKKRFIKNGIRNRKAIYKYPFLKTNSSFKERIMLKNQNHNYYNIEPFFAFKELSNYFRTKKSFRSKKLIKLKFLKK